jgi:DNA-binding NtrC family response regulator
VLEQTLILCNNNRVETARKLGISEKSVYNLMARYQLGK